MTPDRSRPLLSIVRPSVVPSNVPRPRCHTPDTDRLTAGRPKRREVEGPLGWGERGDAERVSKRILASHMCRRRRPRSAPVQSGRRSPCRRYRAVAVPVPAGEPTGQVTGTSVADSTSVRRARAGRAVTAPGDAGHNGQHRDGPGDDSALAQYLLGEDDAGHQRHPRPRSSRPPGRAPS